jgi:hypothetical protein
MAVVDQPYQGRLDAFSEAARAPRPNMRQLFFRIVREQNS